MNDIRAVGRFECCADGFEEISEIISSCIETTQARDVGTISYEWFVNGSRTEIVVQERYADSKSLLDHAGHVSAFMAQLQEKTKVSIEIYGDISDELRQLATAMGIKVFGFYAGFGPA